MGSRLVAVCGVLAALAAGGAAAGTMHFTTRLSGRNEAPAIRSGAVGELQADLDTTTRLLTYKLTYQGLSGPALGAQFHGPAKSGQVAPPTLDVADPANPISGEATLTPAQVADLKKGLWYVNIATDANPAGEIRGQVKFQPPAPEAQRTPMMLDFQRPSAQIGNR
jgi:hypothetical protein